MQIRDREISKVRNGIQIDGRQETINSVVINVLLKDENEKVLLATGLTVPTDGSSGFAKGATFIDTDVATSLNGVYINVGTSSSSAFVSTKGSKNVAITANADGLTTAIIPDYADFVTITSSGATQAVTLPSGASTYVGKKLGIYVGANGLELLTPASSNATINNVDSDGTNQADIPANTFLELQLVAVNTWLMRANTNLGAVATAIVPDND